MSYRIHSPPHHYRRRRRCCHYRRRCRRCCGGLLCRCRPPNLDCSLRLNPRGEPCTNNHAQHMYSACLESHRIGGGGGKRAAGLLAHCGSPVNELPVRVARMSHVPVASRSLSAKEEAVCEDRVGTGAPEIISVSTVTLPSPKSGRNRPCGPRCSNSRLIA